MDVWLRVLLNQVRQCCTPLEELAQGFHCRDGQFARLADALRQVAAKRFAARMQVPRLRAVGGRLVEAQVRDVLVRQRQQCDSKPRRVESHAVDPAAVQGPFRGCTSIGSLLMLLFDAQVHSDSVE